MAGSPRGQPECMGIGLVVKQLSKIPKHLDFDTHSRYLGRDSPVSGAPEPAGNSGMTARRFLTLALVLLGASWSAASACNGRGSAVSFRAAHPTVEPSLPLVLEMRLEGVERTDAEARARLVVVVTTDSDIRDLELELPAASGGEKLDTLELPVQPID